MIEKPVSSDNKGPRPDGHVDTPVANREYTGEDVWYHEDEQQTVEGVPAATAEAALDQADQIG
jgi:hypothetical protein